MCGISGIFSLTGVPVPLNAAVRMNESMIHRGPDGYGHTIFPFTNDPVRIISNTINCSEKCWGVLSQNRLSIIDLSEKGAQPMSSSSGRNWITFNGEIYNYIELSKKINIRFNSKSDTEVLLELWEREGWECLNSLNGMWAFAVISVDRKEITLCRDRFGKKPLYYSIVDGFLIFSSEIKAIFASGLVKKEFNREYIEHYLSYGIYLVQGNNTFYRYVNKLLPSSLLKASFGNKIEQNKYYEVQSSSKLELGEVIEEAKTVFTDSVKLRLRSDVPVACCLSGGVDSTNVVSFASRLLKNSGETYILNTYTVDPGERIENEVVFAKEVAELNGCKWNQVKLPTQISSSDVIDYILTNEEPQEFIGSIVQYLLYKKISSDGHKVIIDGQGGDEVFAGYHWLYYLIYQDALKRNKYLKLIPWLIGLYMNGNNSFKRIKEDGINYYNPLLNKSTLNFNYLFEKIDVQNNATLKIISNCKDWKTQHQAIFFNLELQSLLRDADRNGMRWGLEDRLPFLDYRLLEITQRTDPLNLTFRGYSKFIGRSLATDDMVPKHIRWSKLKKGFYININDLFPQMKELLLTLIPLAKQTNDIVNWKFITDNNNVLNFPIWNLLNVLVLDISDDLNSIDYTVFNDI